MYSTVHDSVWTKPGWHRYSTKKALRKNQSHHHQQSGREQRSCMAQGTIYQYLHVYTVPCDLSHSFCSSPSSSFIAFAQKHSLPPSGHWVPYLKFVIVRRCMYIIMKPESTLPNYVWIGAICTTCVMHCLLRCRTVVPSIAAILEVDNITMRYAQVC